MTADFKDTMHRINECYDSNTVLESRGNKSTQVSKKRRIELFIAMIQILSSRVFNLQA